jgi:hypothetical protein
MLSDCAVATAVEMDWSVLKNGELLTAAEAGGFEVLITADKNLRYQQNLTVRKIAIIELPTNRLRLLSKYAYQVNALVAVIAPGAYEIVADA